MALDQLQRMARAVEENWCLAWASLGAVADEPRTIVDDTPEFLRVYTPAISESLLNLVMRYAVPDLDDGPKGEPVSVADVERTLAPYFAHHLTTQWWLLLGAEPAGLRESLRAAGMQSWGGATAMTASLVDAAPPYPASPREVEFGRVSAGADGEAALAVIAQVFYIQPGPMRRWSLDNPAFRVYAARWNGRVVAALATFAAGQTVGVYHVATRTGARRRGISGNLVRYALRDARREGCTLATLTATPEARHLYELLGFRACGVIEQWLPGYRLGARLTGAPTGFDSWK